MEPKFFLGNQDPIRIKEVYDRATREDKAFAELAMPITATYWRFELGLRPYVQFAGKVNRYGVSGQLNFNVWGPVLLFVDSQYYRVASDDRFSAGVGVLIRFK